MKSNYVNNFSRNDYLTEREKEILSYKRAWHFGSTEEKIYLVVRLLERIHELEDNVEILKKQLQNEK